ncbi:hypothetical protein HY214_03340 [Candidatus Roizmanbacteria bacterium]|nr:hypothetical protein [Candidatus Roizmanbacteria bacterium]
MFFFIAVFIFLVGIISLFAFPALSPVPYFPTNKKDLDLIVGAFNLPPSEKTIIDGGAGDGTVIFAAATAAFQQKKSDRFVAVEINPVLVLILQIRRFFHPNKNSITILWADMLSLPFDRLPEFKHTSIIFYAYLSPQFLVKAVNYFYLRCKSFRLVSYMYPVMNSQARLLKKITGVNTIYVYRVV